MFKKICVAIVLVALSTPLHSQSIIDRHRALFLLKNLATAFLLNAPRPYYEIETSLPEKNKFEADVYTLVSDGYFDLPIYAKFGLRDNLALVGSIDTYTTAYSLTGTKSTGLGDSYAGMSYEFQHSDLIEHYLQFAVKIPTASADNHVGTGKVDYDVGIAQTLTYKDLSYDLTADVTVMNRADFPEINTRVLPPQVLQAIEALKSRFSYDYEQQLNVVFEPTYEFTDTFKLESGAALSRNMKLDFDSTFFYSDLDVTFTKKLDAYAGAWLTNSRQVHYRESSIYSGINYELSKNISMTAEGSVGIYNNKGYLIYTEFDITN